MSGFNFDEKLLRMIGDFIGEREKNTLRFVNPEKYQAMLNFISRFCEYLNKTEQEAKVECNFCTIFNTATVSIETDYVCFIKRKETIDLFSMSDELEIYSLADGNMRLDFTFYDVLKVIKQRIQK